MFNALKNIFNLREANEPIDTVKLTKTLEHTIEKNTTDLFKKHMQSIVKEENDYIVFGVWGAKKDGSLTSEQKEINKTFLAVSNKILSIIEAESLTETQKYAVEYLIRSLFIAKIIYMRAYVKQLMCENGASNLGINPKSPVDELIENIYKNEPPNRNGNDENKRW